MSEELDKLSRLGVQRIYEETRIPAYYIQALLHNSFDGLTKVQFLGFISILEREYNVKLDTLKASGLAYFDEQEDRIHNDSLFVVSHKKRTKAPLYISIAVVLVSCALIFNYFILDQKVSVHNKVDNTLIKNVQKNIIVPKETLIEENNVIAENNVSDSNLSEQTLTDENKSIAETFKIVARSKVWLGYINLQTDKKYQITIENELDLDPNKKWLLFFGHGYVDMSIDGEVQKFDSRSKRKFLYEDQTLKALTSSEYKELSRGLKW